MSNRIKLTSGPGDRSSPMYLLGAKGTVATSKDFNGTPASHH